MIEWLLKEEEKAKVGRPVLVKDKTLKKSIYMLVFSILCVVLLSFSFICDINNKSPLYYLTKYNSSRLLANVKNTNGFIVKSYYKNNDYIINVKVTDKLKSYSGKYRYIVYEYNNQTWNECDTNTFSNNKKSFNIELKRKRNKTSTYKIRLEVTDSAKIKESFAPIGWDFSSDSKNNLKYASKIFTIDGYYSPIDNKELKEAKKEENKINITTDENNPRKFIIDNKGLNYDIFVSYTDNDKKQVNLKEIKNQTDKIKIIIPNLRRVSNITFKISVNDENINVSDYKLSNWEISKEENKKYLVAKYKLKPSGSYK